MVAVSEGICLGQKLGMDAKILSQIWNTSTGRCWSSDTYNPCPGVIDGVPSSRDYEGGFGVDLMLKDLNLAIGEASNVKQPLPAGALVTQLYGLLSKQGRGAKDFGVVFKWLNENNAGKN